MRVPRKLLALLLAMALFVTMLSAAERSAAWPPEDSDCWTNLDFDQATELLTQFKSGTYGEDAAFLYYVGSSSYLQQNILTFIEYTTAAGVHLYGFDQDTTTETLSAFWTVGSFSFSESITFPGVIAYNAETKSIKAAHSVSGTEALAAILKEAGLLSAPSGPETPGTLSYKDSGGLPKLSQQEIARLFADAPLTLPEPVFEETPSCTAPYQTGKVSAAALQAGIDRLNALRRLAGLPDVTLDLELSESAQCSAVISGANGTISHYPTQPDGMDESIYQTGYDAASKSNLAAGTTLTEAMDGFMDDSDESNIARVGHRRWQLNPTLGKVGLGYATTSSSYWRYVTEWVHDTSGEGCAYEFIAWPASGAFPNDISKAFNKDTAWNVSLNPAYYAAPDISAVTVTLKRESDGQTWTFTQQNSSVSGDYFNVENSGYGVASCIIFRPAGIEKYEGTYSVQIDGLNNLITGGTSLAYQVNFFAMGDVVVEPARYTVTTTKYGNGTIELLGGVRNPDGTYSFAEGDEVTVIVTPDEGWTVEAVTYIVDGESVTHPLEPLGNGSYQFSMPVSALENGIVFS